MMKHVFVFALLHLCVSAKSDTNLNKEIINGLNELSHKVNLASDVPVKFPAGRTPGMPQQCLGVIIRELGILLNNVIVKDEDKNYIEELNGNLNALGHCKENARCLMKLEKVSRKTFVQYINFFKKLNTIV